MDIDKIREIVSIACDYGLSSLDIQEGDTTLKIERSAAKSIVVETNPDKTAHKQRPSNDVGVDFNYLEEIKAPMVGVFYAAPAPDAEPYVKVGSKIKKGDVLCIIEAMKLMNEITAKSDGEIVDICVSNGEMVEYGQTIFKIC